jgi:penicillin-binding protein 1C
MILDILKKTPRPSNSGGSPWAKESLDVYWKTGTSQGFRDAWTVGIAGKYILAVWVGNFDGQSNPAFIGKDIAAPLFFEVIDGLRTTERFHAPLRFPLSINVKKVKVCALSGQIPGKHCHHTKETWFKPGTSPIATCDIHREISVHKKTGYRLCNQFEAEGQKRIFEFWPSDLLRIFKQAGLSRMSPPKWDPRCHLDELATNGSAPKIQSPKQDVVYSIRAVADAFQEIAFSAIADADVRETFWFVDEAFIGKSKPGNEVFWTAKSGIHRVSVVDDQGRSDHRELRVEVVN